MIAASWNGGLVWQKQSWTATNMCKMVGIIVVKLVGAVSTKQRKKFNINIVSNEVKQMNDLISRSEICSKLEARAAKLRSFNTLVGDAFAGVISEAIGDIKKAPTIEAEPVVRCKDCDVPHNKWTGCPYMNGLIPPTDHFCSYGERRNGDATVTD